MNMQRVFRGCRIGIALAALWMGCIGVAPGQSTDPGASVAGTVVDEGGKPLSGVRVMLTRASLNAGEANPGVFHAVTGADGAYSVTSMPPGDYSLCASDDSGQYLNPCSWKGAIRVPLAASESKTGVQVVLEPGAEVDVDVADPGKNLFGGGKAGPTHKMVIGFAAAHIFVPAIAGADTDSAKHFSVRVPYDRDVRVFVGSPTLRLADAKGNAMKKGGDSIVIRIPKGQAKTSIAVSVTGVDVGN